MFKCYPRHTINLSLDIYKVIWQMIKSGQVNEGPHSKDFEEEFAHYIGVKYALGISSARLGLYLILKALELNEGDEIIMSSYNFFVVPLIIKLLGLKPIFVDVNETTYNIDTSLVKDKIRKKTKAILVTHMFGQPVDLDLILKIAKENNLKIIEDCAHACGAKYKNKRVGSIGDVAIFSFNKGKNMPCFGGGMITTNDNATYEKIKKMINQYPYPKIISLFKKVIITSLYYFATRKSLFPYTAYPTIRLLDLFGYKLIDRMLREKIDAVSNSFLLQAQVKLTNLQAAVGLKQLARLDSYNDKIRHNALLLTKELNKIKNISIPYGVLEIEPTYLYYHIKIKNAETFRKRLLRKGIDTKEDDMSACSNFDIFNDGDKTSCPIAENLPARSIEIPNNPFLNEKDILYIIEQIRQVSEQIE